VLPPREFVSKVTTVLTDALGPFQMTWASFDEARAAVHELDLALREPAAVIAHASEGLDRMQQTADVRRRLFADIVTAQEQERRRIAEEIHDGALQAMAVVLLRLKELKAAGAEPQDPGLVAQLETSVSDAIGKIRQLIAGLAPHELENAGLVAAVHSLLVQIGTESGIECLLEHHLVHEPRPEQRAIAFRLTQEALANARKHASPSRIDVVLESRDAGVGARIADDGTGFAVEAALQEARPGHMGIAAMRERVELAAGWLHIDSDADGTAVSFWIPDGTDNGAET
jgi:signal transduction histidine kinase